MGKSRRAPASTSAASTNTEKVASDHVQSGGGKDPTRRVADLLREGAAKEAAVAKAPSFRRARLSPPTQNVRRQTNTAGSERVLEIALRPALLAGVAACALTLAAPPPAQAQVVVTPRSPGTQCTYAPSDDKLRCDGNLRDGLTINVPVATPPDPVVEALIEQLTGPISTFPDVDAVFFNNIAGGDSTLSVNAAGTGVGGAFDITVGSSAHGVYGLMGAAGDLAIFVNASILVPSSENEFAIYGVQTNEGDVSISSRGAIDVRQSSGIFAYSKYDTASVGSSGTVSAVKDGIIAKSRYGLASVDSSGGITAQTGIRASSYTGSINVRSTGDITIAGSSTGVGIDAQSESQGGVTIFSAGNITGISTGNRRDIGIFARARIGGPQGQQIYGDIVIESHGEIEVGGTGINAEALQKLVTIGPARGGDIFITSTADITAGTFAGLSNDPLDGIRARAHAGSVTITSTATVSSANGDAIYAVTVGSDSDQVRVTSEGNLYAGYRGIFADAHEGLLIDSDNAGGVIEAGETAIDASSDNGYVTVTSRGDIDAGGNGINAFGETADVTIQSYGVIQAAGEDGYGINAFSESGTNVYVKSDGEVHATYANSTGIYAGLADTSGDDDVVEVISIGKVTAGGTAIYARVDGGDGDVIVNSEGDVYGSLGLQGGGQGGYGIRATATDGDVSIISGGAVSSIDRSAISAYSESGAVSVESTGDVDSRDDIAISARSYNGGVGVKSDGDVSGYGAGIDAYSKYGDVSVEAAGSITVSGGESAGISAFSFYADVEVVSNSDVSAAETGIAGRAYDSGGVSIDSQGAIVVSGSEASGINARGIRSVTVNSVGSITANGAAAYGIYAYSSGEDLDIYSNGAVSAGGTGIRGAAGTENGGDLTIDSVGAVTGVAGYGILAKAKDGNVTVTSEGAVTGGIAAISAYVENTKTYGALSGDITIKSVGDLKATGADGDAVRVVSGFDDSSNVVTIGAGSAVTGGSGVGAGVSFTGGGTNRLENSGTITALSGIAISGGDGAEAIINTGTLVGAVNLAAGNDLVELYTESGFSDAMFDGGEGDDTLRLAGAGVDVLAGGILSNFEILEKTDSGTWSLTGEHSFATSASLLAGVLDLQGTLTETSLTNSGGSLAVGGVGLIGTGTIDGDYVQEAGGDLVVDLDLESGESDLLTVSGAAALAGTVTPSDVNVASDDLTFTILTAEGGVTDNGLTLNDFASPLVSGELIFPNANDVAIAMTIAFTPPDVALTDDQAALAANLERALDAGGVDGALGELFDALFFNIDGAPAYVDALNQLSPEPMLSSQAASYFAAQVFSDGLFSCSDKIDASTLSREGECLWLRVSGGALDVDSDGGTIGFEEDTVGVTAGWQVEVAEGWQVGVAGGFENVEIDTDIGARSEGDRYMGGISVKHQRGPLQMAAALSAGTGEYETTRTVSFGDFSDTLLSSQDVTHAAAELRVAYQFDFDRWYAKPFVDGAATWVDLDDVSESGGAAALAIEGKDARFYSVTPGLELGAELAINKSFALQPFLRAGATFVDNADLALNAGFVEAPAGAGVFVESVTIDDQYLDVEAGATLFKLGSGSQRGGRFGELGSRAAISVVYEGRHGENTKQHSAFIKAAFPF